MAVEALESAFGEDRLEAVFDVALLVFSGTRPDLRKMDDKKRRRTLIQAGQYAIEVLVFADSHKDQTQEMEAIRILREVVVQEFRIVDKEVTPLDKDERKKTPGCDRIVTPHDPDARYGKKRGKGWVGYKVEVAETAESDRPNFITDIQVQNAVEQDRDALEPVVEELVKKEVPPGKLYVDQGYTSGKQIDKMREVYDIDLRGTVAEETYGDMFPQSRFQIDHEKQMAICPNGKQNTCWRQVDDGTIWIHFSPQECDQCPIRPQCTTGKRARRLKIDPHHKTLAARRREQTEESFIKEMHSRNAIEGTISELKRGYHLNKSRYRGEDRLGIQAVFSATASNVKRMVKAVHDGFLTITATQKLVMVE